MQFYRIKQFYWAFQSLIKKDDFTVLNRYLNSQQLNLFMRMSKSERQHSIRVYKSAINYISDKNISDIDKNKMSKCALLHDIGKSQVRINIFEKSFVVIMNKITLGNFLKYNKIKRISNYYNHPRIGAKLLRDSGEKDEDIIECIEQHHNEEIKEKSIYLKILMICDNCN